MSLSRTLEALESFIDAQREIITRAQTDLETLAALKRDVAHDPQSFTEHLTEKLASASLMQLEREPSRPEYIDWKLFQAADPGVFQNVPIPSLRSRELPWSRSARSISAVQQRLQEITHEFRPRITEVVEQMDDDGELQASMIYPPERDISRRPPLKKRKREDVSDGDDDDDEYGVDLSASRQKKHLNVQTNITDPEEPPSATPPPLIAPKGRKPKERPALFKVPWTLHEQHLLEKCLLEIPETEKHRWVKISEAMGGIRTARQVASRVQKYNEKLKKFGLS